MNLWASFWSVLQTILGRGLKSATVGGSVSVTETGYMKYNVSEEGPVPTYIVIHHSFSIDGQTRDWDGIRKYHMSFRYQGETISEKQYDDYKAAGKTAGLERPWKDIGYNLGLEEVQGKLVVQTGRAIKTIGAHAIGFNSESVGICLIGNYDSAPPSDDRLFILGSVCRDLQRMFSIPKAHVIGHRDTFTIRGVSVEKTCPGSKFDMETFRTRLI